MPIVNALLQLVPAPAGAVGVLADLGGRGHRLRQQPGDDVPAAADRRAAVPVRDAGRSSRRYVAGPARHRGHRASSTRSAGTSGPRRGSGTDRGAHVRRRLHARRSSRALVALTHCLVVDLDRPARRGRDAADDAAVARAGEQVARRPLRPGRVDHPRRGRATSGWSSTTSTTCSSGWRRSPRGSAAPTSSPGSRRSRAAARRTSGSARSPSAPTATWWPWSTRSSEGALNPIGPPVTLGGQAPAAGSGRSRPAGPSR